jgi:dihydrolipoamide dehydrogenase
MAREIRLPDIGDFKDVPIIEIHVKPGQKVAKEEVILTLESDKATLDVPSPAAGVIGEVKVKVGDKVSEGALLATLEESGAGAAAKPAPSTPAKADKPAPAQPAPVAQAPAVKADIECDVVVIGAGPGGYTAAFRAADLGQKVALVEKDPVLGGVCLNVGCIPSKALLHAAKVIDEAADFASHGIMFGAPKVELDPLRAWKDGVVKRLTGGLNTLARQRKVTVVTGAAKFSTPNTLSIATAEGVKTLLFKNAIIACGSEPIAPGFIPKDPRIVDSTGALEIKSVPKRMLVLGGGIIGLEMATVYHALGAKVTVVELMDQLIPGADRDIVAPLAKRIEKRYEKILLKTKVTAVEAKKDGLHVVF